MASHAVENKVVAPLLAKQDHSPCQEQTSPPVTVFVARTIKEKKAQLKAAGKQ